MTHFIVLFVVCLVFVAWREYRHDRERATLLNRIQAPSVAVAQSIDNPEPATHISFEDDEAYWTAREEMNGRS